MSAIIDFIEETINSHSTFWLIGQIVGIVAIIFGFVSYQVKTKRMLLFMQGVVAFLFCTHYALLGAYTGLSMNVVALIRNIVYNKVNQGSRAGRLMPIIFIVILCGISIITWEAWYSLFAICGIVVNTYCMSFKNPQNVRKSIFISSPLVLCYNVFSWSVGGIIYEMVAIASSLIGFLRNREKSVKE